MSEKTKYPYPYVESCWVCGCVEMEFRSYETDLGQEIYYRAHCPGCGTRFAEGDTPADAQGVRNRECAEKRGAAMVWIAEPRD